MGKLNQLLLSLEPLRSKDESFRNLATNTEALIKLVDFYQDKFQVHTGKVAPPVEGGGEFKAAITLKNAINTFEHYYNIAKFRTNLSRSAKELPKYSKNYVTMMGSAVAHKIDQIRSEYTNDINRLSQHYNVDGKNLNQEISNYGFSNRENLENDLYMLRLQLKAKENLYKVAQSVDLYLQEFTDSIANSPEDIREVSKLLGSVELMANWFNEKSGNAIASLYELPPVSGDDNDTKAKNIKKKVLGADTIDDIVKKNPRTTIGDKEHYYQQLDVNGSAETFLGNCNQAFEKSKHARYAHRFAEYAMKKVYVLKNIISVFAYLGKKYGTGSNSGAFMSPNQMYECLMNYLSVSAFTRSLTGSKTANDTFKEYLMGYMKSEHLKLESTYPYNNNGTGHNKGPSSTKLDFTADEGKEFLHILKCFHVDEIDNADKLGERDAIVKQGESLYEKKATDNEARKLLAEKVRLEENRNRTRTEILNFVSNVERWYNTRDLGVLKNPEFSKKALNKFRAYVMRNFPDETAGKPESGKPSFKFAKIRQTADTVYHRSDFDEEDEIFVNIIKAMAAKVFTVTGLYNMLNYRNKDTIMGYALSPTRLIMGGNVNGGVDGGYSYETPKIYPEAIELYARLPLLAEFYKSVFCFKKQCPDDKSVDTDGENDDTHLLISMVPEVGSLWAGLIRTVFDQPDDTNGLYTVSVVKKLIHEINNVYQVYKSKNSKSIVTDAINDFIAEINNRYGIMARGEIKDYQREDKTRRGFDLNNPGDELEDYDILNEDNLGTGVAPSDRFTKVSSLLGVSENTLDPRLFKALKVFRRRIESRMAEHMLKISSVYHGKDTKIPSQGFDKVDFKDKIPDFNKIVMSTRNEVKQLSNQEEQFNLVSKMMSNLDSVSMINTNVAIMYHELIIMPLALLTNVNVMLEGYITALKGAVETANGKFEEKAGAGSLTNVEVKEMLYF